MFRFTVNAPIFVNVVQPIIFCPSLVGWLYNTSWRLYKARTLETRHCCQASVILDYVSHTHNQPLLRSIYCVPPSASPCILRPTRKGSFVIKPHVKKHNVGLRVFHVCHNKRHEVFRVLLYFNNTTELPTMYIHQSRRFDWFVDV